MFCVFRSKAMPLLKLHPHGLVLRLSPSVDQMPQDFNFFPMPRTEEMIQFHLKAANIQLRQAYYGFVAAMALNRTFIMPKVTCVHLGLTAGATCMLWGAPWH